VCPNTFYLEQLLPTIYGSTMFTLRGYGEPGPMEHAHCLEPARDAVDDRCEPGLCAYCDELDATDED